MQIKKILSSAMIATIALTTMIPTASATTVYKTYKDSYKDTWTYCIKSDGAYITQYDGDGNKGVVTVPSKLGGKTVVEICDGNDESNQKAFSYNNKITKVIIPSVVKRVGTMESMYDIFSFVGPFFECKNLKAIVLNEGLTSIGATAFVGTGITNLEIPNSVTSLGDAAAHDCLSLKTVKLGEGIKKLVDPDKSGANPFGFTTIEKIEVSEDFSDPNIGQVVKPSAVKGGDYTTLNGVLFNKAKTILIKYPNDSTTATYTIPSTVKTISATAFENAKVQKIVIPASVTTIETHVFFKCSKLGNITVNSSNKYFMSENNKVLYNKAKTRLIKYCETNTATSYTVPKTVTEIDDDAIIRPKTNMKLTALTILNSSAKIGDMTGECYDANTGSIQNGNSLTLIGYKNSTAQTYAEKNKIKFQAIGSSTVINSSTLLIRGDANLDGRVSVADARKIILCISNGSADSLKNNIGYDYSKNGKVTVEDAKKLMSDLAKNTIQK